MSVKNFRTFQNVFVKLFETVEKRDGRSQAQLFFSYLENIEDSISALQQTANIVISGGVVPGPTPPAPVVPSDLLAVVNTIGAFPGQFVSCAANTLQLADATAGPPGIQATHVVVSTDATFAYLSNTREDIDVLLLAGSGDDGNGNIYLATGGAVTRRKADIVDDSGVFVGSYTVLQNLGTWTSLSGAVGPGFTRSSVKVSDASIAL